MTLKLLVTGAAGLLGSRVALSTQNSFQTTAAYHLQQTNLPMGCQRSAKVDLCDDRAVNSLFADFKFSVVINCAGASNVDLCETDRDYATRGNYQTSLILARAAAKFGSRLIQISTDYVFDGDSGPSSENNSPAPINFYGRSKLMAEKAVMDTNPANTIVRVCSLYSKDLSARPNPFNSIVNSLKNGSPYTAVDDLYSNPTEVSDLAAAICQLAQLDKLPRIIHLAPSLYQSRFEFATQVAKLLSLDQSLIKRVSLADLNLKAKRPRKAGLKSTIAASLLKKSLLSLTELL